MPDVSSSRDREVVGRAEPPDHDIVDRVGVGESAGLSAHDDPYAFKLSLLNSGHASTAPAADMSERHRCLRFLSGSQRSGVSLSAGRGMAASTRLEST
jgi:hypothetical protein